MQGASVFALAQQTVSICVETNKFYSDRFAGVNTDSISYEDFLKLPPLSKKELRDFYWEIAKGSDVPDFVMCTSGTSWKTKNQLPTLHFHTLSEKEAALTLKRNSLQSSGPIIPLQVNLFNSIHGINYLGGSKGVLDLPLERKHHVPVIIDSLNTEFSFDGFSRKVTVLSGSLSLIKILTTLIIENEAYRSATESVKTVLVYGWRLTTRWKNLIEQVWSAKVIEVYGLSEVPGMSAVRCEYCGLYHLSKTVFGEVVSVNDPAKIVKKGVGELLVTTFFPLSEFTPLIRYQTQDIIEVHGICPATNNVSFELLGRREQIPFFSGDNGAVLAPITPYIWTDVLDQFSEISVTGTERALGIGVVSKLGWPKYKVEQYDENTVKVSIEVKWDPILYPSNSEKLVSQISKMLLARCKSSENCTVNLVVELLPENSTNFCAME